MSKENKETNLPEVQEVKKETGIAVKSDVMFASVDINQLTEERMSKIIAAPSINFDVKPKYWKPADGEVIRVLYQGIKEKVRTKNKFAADPEFVYIDTAYFVELKAGKKQMLSNASTVIVSYFKNNNVPVHALLDIQYNGKVKGDKFMFDDFSIMPVPVNFD